MDTKTIQHLLVKHRLVQADAFEDPDGYDNAETAGNAAAFGREITRELITGRLATFVEGCVELERQITLGGKIGWQDRKWWLFEEGGEGIVWGATIEELILTLGEVSSETNVSGQQRLTEQPTSERNPENE